MMSFIIFLLFFLFHGFTSQVINNEEADPTYWHQLSLAELEEAVQKTPNTNIAKNIIIIVGDGMGISTLTAARIHKGQLDGHTGEETKFEFENFPYMGLVKTYDIDHQVPDSASTATAMLCGSKAKSDVIALSGAVNHADQDICGEESYLVHSIGKYAVDSGKDVGFVTTARVTHATPACLYAHTPNRDWECNSEDLSEDCKDIGRQLIEDEPGKSFKVIMGGGRQTMVSGAESSPDDPLSTWACNRTDDRDLISEWQAARGGNARVARTLGELQEISAENTDYLMGVFYNNHMPYKYELKEDIPTLAEMSRKAIEILQKNNNGFMLLIEGAKIDLAHHLVQANAALLETIELDKAVSTVLDMVNIEETLIIVTADHSHPVTIHGYNKRGSNIMGLSTDMRATDGLPFTILMYTNGESFDQHFIAQDGETVERKNISNFDVQSYEFQQASGVPVDVESETHSGEDVPVYAIGPMAHLFHGLHDQTYIYHVMTYSACLGEYHDNADCRSARDGGASDGVSVSVFTICLSLFLCLCNNYYK